MPLMNCWIWSGAGEDCTGMVNLNKLTLGGAIANKINIRVGGLQYSGI
jgi:hypothetical protein